MSPCCGLVAGEERASMEGRCSSLPRGTRIRVLSLERFPPTPCCWSHQPQHSPPKLTGLYGSVKRRLGVGEGANGSRQSNCRRRFAKCPYGTRVMPDRHSERSEAWSKNPKPLPAPSPVCGTGPFPALRESALHECLGFFAALRMTRPAANSVRSCLSTVS